MGVFNVQRCKTDEYKGKDLYDIFVRNIELDSKINAGWFEKHLVYFKFFGRDIETLLSKTKISHSRRVFCKSVESKKIITLQDLEKGFELYLKNDEVKSRKDSSESRENLIGTMYV